MLPFPSRTQPTTESFTLAALSEPPHITRLPPNSVPPNRGVSTHPYRASPRLRGLPEKQRPMKRKEPVRRNARPTSRSAPLFPRSPRQAEQPTTIRNSDASRISEPPDAYDRTVSRSAVVSGPSSPQTTAQTPASTSHRFAGTFIGLGSEIERPPSALRRQQSDTLCVTDNPVRLLFLLLAGESKTKEDPRTSPFFSTCAIDSSEIFCNSCRSVLLQL